MAVLVVISTFQMSRSCTQDELPEEKNRAQQVFVEVARGCCLRLVTSHALSDCLTRPTNMEECLYLVCIEKHQVNVLLTLFWFAVVFWRCCNCCETSAILWCVWAHWYFCSFFHSRIRAKACKIKKNPQLTWNRFFGVLIGEITSATGMLLTFELLAYEGWQRVCSHDHKCSVLMFSFFRWL